MILFRSCLKSCPLSVRQDFPQDHTGTWICGESSIDPDHVYWPSGCDDDGNNLGDQTGTADTLYGGIRNDWIEEKMKMKNKQTAGSFGVIGLGRFGTALAITLSEAGKDVDRH